MTKIQIDTTEVAQLAVDMRGIDARLARWVRPVVARGALNIKNDIRDSFLASKHFKGAAPGVSYDLTDNGYGADIGPAKGKPGSLANIAIFGTWKGGGTVEDPVEALNRETPAFEKNLADVAADLVLGR